jgi:hypothetical protein
VKKYKKLCKKYIVFSADVEKQVEKLFHFYKDKKILGIHKRGRDHLTVGHARQQSHKIDDEFMSSLIKKNIDNYDYIYLTSDETHWYNFLKKEYGDNLLFWDDKSQMIDGTVGLHHYSLLDGRVTDEDKEKRFKDLITEILILSKCDKMLLMNSNVSHMALFFSDHYNYEFYDCHLMYS